MGTCIINLFLLFMCSEIQISQKMADSACPDVYVWCELPVPICSNLSSFHLETTNKTEDADDSLSLSKGETSMWTVHKGKKETKRRQRGDSGEASSIGLLVLQGQRSQLRVGALHSSGDN
jgi:hypothetical protein